MGDNFYEVIMKFEEKSIAAMEKAFKDSVKGLVSEFTTTHMPVKTGYLRNSLEVSFNSMPLIDPMSNPADRNTPNQFPLDNTKAFSKIDTADKDTTIYVGFTAAYAGYQESKQAYVRLPVQDWQQIVNRSVSNANK